MRRSRIASKRETTQNSTRFSFIVYMPTPSSPVTPRSSSSITRRAISSERSEMMKYACDVFGPSSTRSSIVLVRKTLSTAYIALSASKTKADAIMTSASTTNVACPTRTVGTKRLMRLASISEPPVVALPRRISPKPTPEQMPPNTVARSISSVAVPNG